jgi:zona occludens toxin (predicted ATPase)
MAVIARKLVLLFAAAAVAAHADQAQDVLRAVNQIASALTDGSPSDAIAPFDKSVVGYETLENEFVGLTNAYQIANEVEVLDEDDSPGESKLTLRWTITLTNIQSSESSRKSAEVHVRLRLQKKQWKIVEFSPVDLFTP